MRVEPPVIMKTAERMVDEVERAVAGFSRYHKNAHGTDLRRSAKAVLVLINRAWLDQAQRARWITDLVWAMDELRINLQIGKRNELYRSFKEFEQLIRTAEALGRQIGGWQKKHAKGQNAAPPTAAQQRPQILSGPAASPLEAKP